MFRCALPFHGAPGSLGETGVNPARIHRLGFTLLEMCMVLFILALLVAVTMPAMESALTEQAVRRDSHQLALMVKTAMIQSAEQHRAYVIDLTTKTMALHPLGTVAAEADDSSSDEDDDTTSATVNKAVEVTTSLDAGNQLQIPNPEKANSWMTLAGDGLEWTFQPGELCPATDVRFKRGDAWLQMSFDALTGNVQREQTEFP
jgi:prepilin-type N-terminal cleavage/methylation domain-containing protein